MIRCKLGEREGVKCRVGKYFSSFSNVFKNEMDFNRGGIVASIFSGENDDDAKTRGTF